MSDFVFFFLMIRRPPRSTRTDTLFPYTTLFRSISVNDLAVLGIESFRASLEASRRRAGYVPILNVDFRLEEAAGMVSDECEDQWVEFILDAMLHETVDRRNDFDVEKAIGCRGLEFIDVVAIFSRVAGARQINVRTHKMWSNTAVRSEEHTSELQSLMRISYAHSSLKKT